MTQHLGPTWLEGEALTYPSGGFKRRARVVLRRNPHNPIELRYGSLRIVHASIPDTFSSIPARLRVAGQTIIGYVSVDPATEQFAFTPEAANCRQCAIGEGCRF